MKAAIRTDSNASPETSVFLGRFFAAAADYAKFVAGAIALALFCMATYALVNRTGTGLPGMRNWLLPLSLIVNLLAVLSVSLTLYLLRRIARLEKQLAKRDIPDRWPGMLQQ
jgi:hypothetical protein